MKPVRSFLAVASLALLATSAPAQDVGAGNDTVGNELVDTGGGRINVDTSTPLTLAAGDYIALTFNFDSGIAGDVTPFLAVLTSPNVYQAIAVGNPQTITGVNIDANTAFAGSANFTLAATTTIFAGISSQTQNPIFLDDGTAQNTDHEGVGQADYTVTVGGTVPPDGSFSNPDLGRTYAFSITVAPIPEPTALAATLLGGLALGLRRRRS